MDIEKLKELSDKATPGHWYVFDNFEGTFGGKNHYDNGAYSLMSNDCKSHAVADFSCNHTCRDGAECGDNAVLAAVLVNMFRAGQLVVREDQTDWDDERPG